jgi:hypothetical protein
MVTGSVPQMRTSLFAFASDLAGEGTDAVLANVRDRAGVDDLTLAAAYHEARDLYPHNPAGRLRHQPGGRVFFRPSPERWSGLRLQPLEDEANGGGDPLEEACAAAAEHGGKVNAWVVFLHADRLGFEHPECAPMSALGDRVLTDLCPADPHVQAYARTLAADVATRPVRSVRAESLHFHGLGHGAHHERYGVALDPLAELLLGLCFCPSCESAAQAAGVEVAAVRRLAAAEAERALAGDARAGAGAAIEPGAAGEPGHAGPPGGPTDPARAAVAALADGQLGRYIAVRERIVTALAADITAVVHGAGRRLVFIEASGAAKGYADGRPAGAPAAEAAWRVGADPLALARATDGIEVLGYARDPARVAADLAAYGDVAALGLRIMHPDCDGPENLRAKVEAARAAGVRELDFYHYGLAPLASLDWVRSALSDGAEAVG